MPLNPFNAEATFVQSTRTQRILKTSLTLSCWYSLHSSRRVLSVSMCQGFNHFLGFLHNFVLAKLAISEHKGYMEILQLPEFSP